MAVSPSRTKVRDDSLFPSWFVWALFAVTLAFRVHYVLQPDNWWTVHPDEVYQTMEVAHAEAYGYGFRTYEFNPPLRQQDMFTPELRRREQIYGMAAMRSYILPHFYVMVTCLLGLVGLSFNPFLAWKVAHTVVASTLPLAVHRYVTSVFRSHDIACLAAMLVSACAQLHVLGTHSLVNSLLAPVVFLVLGRIHGVTCPPLHQNPDTAQQAAQDGTSHDSMTRNDKGKHVVKNGRQKTKEKFPNHKSVSNSQIGSKHKVKTLNANGCPSLTDENKNISKSPKGTASSTNGINGHGPNREQSHSRKSPKHSPLWTIKDCKDASLRVILDVLTGAVLGVCVYVRFDLIALPVCSLLPHWSPRRTLYWDVVWIGVGGVLGLAIGVMEDFRCYGWGVLTPLNWFRFNVQQDFSTILFGRDGWLKYVVDIFLQNWGMVGLTVVSLACGALHWPRVRAVVSSRDQSELETGSGVVRFGGRVRRTCASWLLLLVLYSRQGHKELRFVHNVIVLVIVTWAAVIQSALAGLLQQRKWRRRLTGGLVAVFALSQWLDVRGLVGERGRGGNKLAFQTDGDTQDVNQCLYRLSGMRDVTGVFLDRNLYASGGYSLLHHDVPIFTFFGNNFHEYRREDRLREAAKTRLGPQTHISVSYVGQFSNYVTKENSPYVIKFLLEDPRYNYFVVLGKRRVFSQFGLTWAFNCGHYKVYHRPRHPSPEQARMVERSLQEAPHVKNASLLLLEADMLYFHGAFSQAAHRFQLLLHEHPAQVAAYLPLASALHLTGNTQEASRVMTHCYQQFGNAKCDTRRPFAMQDKAVFGLEDNA